MIYIYMCVYLCRYVFKNLCICSIKLILVGLSLISQVLRLGSSATCIIRGLLPIRICVMVILGSTTRLLICSHFLCRCLSIVCCDILYANLSIPMIVNIRNHSLFDHLDSYSLLYTPNNPHIFLMSKLGSNFQPCLSILV